LPVAVRVEEEQAAQSAHDGTRVQVGPDGSGLDVGLNQRGDRNRNVSRVTARTSVRP
jgi:hypothetical protein